MTPAQMKERTRQFGIRIIKVTDALPAKRSADVIGRQLLRAGTSVGANYRAACRARSTSEFMAKLGIVEEEADECLYWLELLIEAKLLTAQRLVSLMKECNEILSIIIASINTARGGSRTSRSQESAIRNPQSAIGGSRKALEV